jgi:hypothetical protein
MKQNIITIMQYNINLFRRFAVSLFGSIVSKTNFSLLKKTLFYSNNNIPLRLTSVAHLGGFSFNIGV